MDDFCISDEYGDDGWGINIILNEKIKDVNLAIQVSHGSGLYLVDQDGYLTELISELKDVDELVKNMDHCDMSNRIIIHNYCAKRLRDIISAINPTIVTSRLGKYR